MESIAEYMNQVSSSPSFWDKYFKRTAFDRLNVAIYFRRLSKGLASYGPTLSEE